ncbi:hydroxymethylglutaryl-CoA synthase [Cyberlindnera jadinii NRRL Y-1542]|uniref:Hydroxymethylglutaryl-CoA synthase n=1 Tax=Cyberlindnera jadinii (strain ATCC 18201 / CBS 1600 / BCRC 20928 / JCM 3617 / NBRC 0987 / NRRL Y-1542) TaxID=983966 RepID=A0A1E4RYV5_CYBJN|nr:hydroxymethylglutaryl-CoA synthase [Cyberlindnera jadinii NRRL Y-1542]ODV72446.1 hydroxymethylglutaryl-CoA synthase [Cyberlindnera jadinii NRRL Y-1542]
MSRPQNIGIKAIEVYIPGQAVNQAELEKFDGVSAGKYTIGLGQTNMGFVNDREDIYSMTLTVLSKLIKNYDIDVNNIGRLEVGTETLLDKSKSVKSVLTQLLGDNTDTEGIDTINACYGGTNALFNSINWVESSAWDGRDAVVVCGDIAIYEKGAARPTGGAGTVALLIGPDAPIVFDNIRGSFMEHAYDFYKPDFTSEYPYVDGHFSLACYVKALDKAYAAYSKKAIKAGVESATATTVGATKRFDYNAFHVPTCKLVVKSYARLLYNDFRANPELFPEVDKSLAEMSYEDSLSDKTVEKTFVALAKELTKERVQPSLQVPTNTGNMYTASLYAALSSLLFYVGSEKLQGKRIGLFSYGSGLAASLFSAVVKGDITYITEKLDLDNKLNSRKIATPDEYEAALALREAAHLKKNFTPVGSLENVGSGVYYLTEVNDRFHRKYAVKE